MNNSNNKASLISLLDRYKQEVIQDTLTPNKQLLLTELYLKDLTLHQDQRKLNQVTGDEWMKYFTLGYYLYQFMLPSNNIDRVD